MATAASANTATMPIAIPNARSYLQLEEDAVVPREDEVEARSPEERTDDDDHRPHHHEQREDRDRELAVLRVMRRVLVDEWRHREEEQPHSRDRHSGHHRVEHREQFLEAEEVPGRLRRVRRLVEV